MPKERKQKIARTSDDAAKIPLDQPVTFEMPEPDQPNVAQAQPQKAEAPSVTVETRQPAEDAAPDLAQQLADLKQAEASARQRAEQEAKARQAAEQQLQSQAREIEQSQADAVAAGISATQVEIDGAKADYSAALAAQDFNAAADAQWRMTQAGQRLSQLEAGKEEIERQRAQPRQQQPQQVDVKTVIDRFPSIAADPQNGIHDSERAWLRLHPEALGNPRMAERLRIAVEDSQRRKLERGSPEYFAFVNERLDYASAADQDGDIGVVVDEPARRVAAPPSRSVGGPSGTRSEPPGRVTLTPAMLEAAKWSGCSPEEYAQGLLKLRAYKHDGFYSDS